jgi:type I restriction enzyme S subunit
MNGIRAPWDVATVADVARLEMGQSPDGQATNMNGEGTPLIGGAGDYTEGRIKASRYTTQPTKICRKGDLILCIRATIGKVALADKAYCLGRGVAGLRPAKVTPDFLRYFLNSQARAMDEAGTGTTFRQIDKKTLSSWPIPLPETKEQERIVVKLDRLFERSTSAREELAHIPRLVERYKQAILAAAFSGDLTADWRKCHAGNAGDFLKPGGMLHLDDKDLPHLPNGWSWVAAGTLCAIKSGVTLGKKRPPGAVLIERPYLRVANVQRGWLNLDEIKTIAVTEKEADMLYLRPGDVLMNEGGDRDKLGRGWVWNGEIPQCIHQNHVFRLRPRIPEVPSKYISYYANEFGQNYFLREGKQTTNLASISMGKISALPIPIAPPDEMARVVALIESGFAAIDKIAAEASRATDLLDRLDQATLTKAFRGELVEQQPVAGTEMATSQ